MNYNNCSVLTAEAVASILNVSTSCAYKKIKLLNDELNQKGYETTHGRVSKKYFCKRYCIEL